MSKQLTVFLYMVFLVICILFVSKLAEFAAHCQIANDLPCLAKHKL